MTDPITNAVQTFVGNPWVLLLIALGGILIVIGYSTSFFKYVYDYSQRPKLTFKASKHRESFMYQDKYLYDRINFFIDVKNEGNRIATQSRATLKITNEDGLINLVSKLSFYSPNQVFPVFWKIAGEEKESVNILHSEANYNASVKIPFRIDIPVNYAEAVEKGIPTITMMFENPIESWKVGEAMKSETLKYAFSIRIEIEVYYGENGRDKKQFVIGVSWLDNPISPDKIEFKEVSTH